MALYAASDDETDIIYRWGVGWDVYQSASNFVTYSSDGEDKVWLGCLGSTTNDRLYTGLVFDEVLNSQYDYVEGYMQAVIELTAAAVNTNAFQIAVMGELERDEDGSSALGLGPPVLQSPGYGSPPPYDRIIRDPSDPEWDINTTIVTSVIPAAAVNEKVFINVTEQVDEMFRAVRDGARHEMGVNLGFVIWGLETTPGLLKFRDQESLLRIEVSRAPWWKPGGLTEEEDVAVPYERKSSATVFDDGNGEFVMFGGIDGVSVLDDTWISGGGDWIQAEPEHRPPARWGHGMAYAGLVIVFGGFGEDNEPLNDLWVWDGEDWSEITVFARDGAFVNEKPPPRGAMAFGSAGGQVVLFGGTDGDRYLNDTWVLETGSVQEPPVDIGDAWRWVMMVPPGEQNDGPMGRAYPFVGSDYVEGMILFGGRVGTLPTATDTDGDWIDDGVEIDLGGPSAGRDPRVNALYDEALVLNPDEKIPYAFKLLGGMELSLGYYRDGAIADFESLAHPEGLWFNGLNLYSYGRYPAEGTYNPPPTPVLPETGWFRTGYQALIPNDPASVDQWWHRFGYTEMTDNPLDEWELGTPFGPGDNTAPPYAYSGRWCYGTDLDGLYENNVVISLYSPFLDLRVPADDSTSEADNTNDWYLVFHEWLDLADEQDAVRVEVIRPNLGEFGEYTADILKRWSGTEPPREPVLVLPERNGAHNTTGEWRRVIVPVNLKEEGIFFAFVLESDGDGTAGGWYIDDVALIQGGKISGNYSGSDVIYLLGADGTNWLRKTTAETGVFTFELLPAGEYRIATGLGDNFTGNPVGGDGTWHLYIEELAINEILLSISVNSPVHLAWNAIPGANYEIQYTTPELLGSPDPWMTLDTVTATDEIGNYIDWDSEGVHSRLYRILFTGLPWE